MITLNNKPVNEILEALLLLSNIREKNGKVQFLVKFTNYSLDAELEFTKTGHIFNYKLLKGSELIPLTTEQEEQITDHILIETSITIHDEDYAFETLNNYLEHGVNESDFISYTHK